MNPTLFLDRDGVINKKRNDYVKNINEFEFLPNVLTALKKLNHLGVSIIIITNQSVINRKIISEEQLKKIHEYMLKKFNGKSISLFSKIRISFKIIEDER